MFKIIFFNAPSPERLWYREFFFVKKFFAFFSDANDKMATFAILNPKT